MKVSSATGLKSVGKKHSEHLPRRRCPLIEK
jgi:hypothetical protein